MIYTEKARKTTFYTRARNDCCKGNRSNGKDISEIRFAKKEKKIAARALN